MLRVLIFFAFLIGVSRALLLHFLPKAQLPVEVLSLDLDVGHTIAGLALPHFAVGFFLAGTHGGGEVYAVL